MKSINIYSIRLAILLTCLVFTITAFADVKIKSRQTANGQTSENTTYIKGKRQRVEQNNRGSETVNITQCDLRRDLQLMPQSKIYSVDFWTSESNVTTTTTMTAKNTTTETVTQKGGLITSTVTTKDTGERKQMFGYTARHLIITIETKSSPNACSKSDSKMEFDGWYIDAAFVLDCITDRYKNYVPNSGKAGCQDRYETKQVGTAKRGYPIYEKTTMFDAGGKETYSSINEVIELSNATLEAALFEAPSDYLEVKNRSELYASTSSSSVNAGSSSSNISNNSAVDNSGLKNLATELINNTTEVTTKKEGTVRIGLVNIKTGSVGEGMNAQELAAAVQNSLSEYLKNPKIELVNIEAKLPSSIDAEAKEKQCDFVLYANVSHKKGGGGFGGMFGKTLGSVISQTGIGQTGSTIGNVVGQVATQSIIAATLTSNTKSKDQITLDINLKPASGGTALTKQFKAKAKSNGEDIITPVIEQAAQAIFDLTVK